MNQISEENYSRNNNIKNDIETNLQKIYSKTSPINKSQENPKINTIDNTIHYFYPTSVDKAVKYTNIYNNNNINKPAVTNNDTTSLVKNLEVLDNDNIKLREALSELNLELKDKEEEINESQKILRKINEEYTQLIKEYKKLEEQKNLYQQENEKNKKMLDNMNKNFNEYDKIMKQNEQLKNELMKNKEIVNNLKGNYTNVSNGFNIIEKDRKDKEIIIKDLKIEGNKIINMLKDRELLIEEYSKKISELNQIIKEKDEKLKLMVNFTKELNTENKTNVKELTKQAVKTIKVFYNSMNNKDNSTQVNFVEIIKSDNDKNINKNNISEIIFGNNKNNDKNNKCSFLLNEALENVLYIPDIGINYINKEFLIDNNFKTCLLKTELFSSIIREFNLYSFLENKFSKLNDTISKFNLLPYGQQKDGEIPKKQKFGEIGKNFVNIKIMFDKINKNANKYKKENISLKTKLKELILYINKLKKEFNDKIKKFKEKFKNIDDKYKIYLSNLEQKNKNINKPNNKENPVDNKNKEEISKLYQEIDKIKNMNHNMQQNIIEKDEIIMKLKNENEQLFIKLNAFRTNPNAGNNFKFYNSFSLANNNKQKENMNNINLSNISNYNNKFNTNKCSNSNDYFFDFSLNDNLSNTSMKYSTKATSKHNKKRNIRNIIKNINEFSNNNTFNENDITNKFIKSFSNNFNFYNLQIENQEQFNYISYNKPNNINIEKSKSKKNIFSINPNSTDDENNCTANFQNSKIFEKELINNIFFIINNFKSEIKEDIFRDLIKKNCKIGKIIQLLSNKIEEIKNNLSNIKEKFKNNHKDKKIKPLQLVEIMEQVEKLLLYVNNHLNKTNNDMQNIQPFLNNVFDLVSKIVYDSPISTINNSFDITQIPIGINTLQNSALNNNNNPINNIKDNIIKNNNLNNIKFDNNKIINQEIEDINNNIINSSTRTKESILPNIQELKQFFDINKKIFSSSELIKYKTIYEGLPISQLLQVFKDICENLKKTVFNSKNEYDSDMSDFEDSNEIEETKTSQVITENFSYHVVNQKIFGLKKFEFNYKIFMELLKNYLVTFEIIVNQIEIEIKNKNRDRQIQLGEEINILYNIFEDAVYFKMDILDDDIIFNRKILLKLLLNHKEYLSIIYDI